MTAPLIPSAGTILPCLKFHTLGFSPDALTGFLRHKAGWAITPDQTADAEGAGFDRLSLARPQVTLPHALERLHPARKGSE